MENIKESIIKNIAKLACNVCEMGGNFDGDCSDGNKYHKCSISMETAEKIYDYIIKEFENITVLKLQDNLDFKCIQEKFVNTKPTEIKLECSKIDEYNKLKTELSSKVDYIHELWDVKEEYRVKLEITEIALFLAAKHIEKIRGYEDWETAILAKDIYIPEVMRKAKIEWEKKNDKF